MSKTDIVPTAPDGTAVPASLPRRQENMGLAEITRGITLPAERESEVQTLVDGYDFRDTTAPQTFLANEQRDISRYLDDLLGNMRTGEAGTLGDITISLAKGIDLMKIDQLKREAEDGLSLLARLPWIGKLFSQLRYFAARKQRFTSLMAEIERRATENQSVLIEDLTRTDKLADRVLQQIPTIAVGITAGARILALGEEKYETLRQEAVATGDVQIAAQARDLDEILKRFEKRVIDLKLNYVELAKSIPQIRTTQEAGRLESDNINSVILNHIPKVKSIILNVASLHNTMKAQREADAHTTAMRQLEALQADMTDKAYTAARKSQGNALDSVKALEESTQALLRTLAKGAEIDRENAKKNLEASRRLQAVMNDVREALVHTGA